MIEVDLEQILNFYLKLMPDEKVSRRAKYFVKQAMKEACNRTVDLCIKHSEAECIDGVLIVSEDSILVVKEMIK